MVTRKHIELIGANLTKLGARRLIVLGLVVVVVVSAVVVAARILARPAMQSIYTGLSSQDVTRMAEALGEAGISFDINEQRNSVLVAFGQAAKARTLLAQKGLPASARAGYELFDQLGSMGLTSFMQEVTRVRALEGEIARTIQALDGVAAARVHLVPPESSSFRRERREPSASVLLRLDTRWHGQAGQTVRHIVAAAVPGMKVEHVSVASTDGRLLASGGDEKTAGSTMLAELERSVAAELEQRASRTLASTLGPGNFQISVTARLDVDRQQTNETVFDPKSRIERSVRIIKQSGSTEDGGGKGAVGVEANVPREETNQTDSDKRRQKEDRKEELVNYELNSKTVQTVREGYRIQRLAIAAVVNRKQIATQIGAGADATAVNSRIADLKRLIAAATGANPEREDSIEISAVEFNAADVALAPAPGRSFVDHVMQNLGTIINAFAAIALAVLVVVLCVRPALAVLGREPAPARPAPSNSPALEGPQHSGGPVEPGAPSDAGTLSAARTADRPRIAIKPPEAVVRDRLESLVQQDDVKVAKVLRNWMAEARSS